ncbi:MarR family winged helix-turn-helix transcriptional regulator [Liquorilactobacillus satsumensis]|uniref:MarR family winged helix-turn-helix transcriptional regulator n=1 Tax=Liquorilactobacillus satsumensis TaxID=259059 RepID=UPI0039EBC604
MTYDSQELLTLFGRLFQQHAFVAAAIKSTRFGDQQRPQDNRGPLRLLQLLTEKEQLTNSEIVEELDIRPSSVSALVRKLEEEELVARRESPTDKRVLIISLTAKGTQFINDSHKLKDELSESLFSALSAEEQQQLRTLLRKLLADLDEKAPFDWHNEKGNNFYDFMKQLRQMHHGFERSHPDFKQRFDRFHD